MLLTNLLAQTRDLDSSTKEIVGDIPTIKGLEALFNNVVSLILGFGAIALFIMLLVGGVRYLTSGGDEKALEASKKTLTTAIGGLVLLVISYLILVLIENITGAKITQFKIFQ